MSKIEIVVVGASAGGVEALSKFVKQLPEDFPASVFVVLHFPQNATSVLAKILTRVGALPAESPTDNQRIEKGKIYVAPPGCHMLVKKGKISIVHGPKENGHRPAIDPLFRSAARNYGSRAAAVVLSGMLDDGVIGVTYIKKHGGLVFVQDPDDALFSAMPLHAMNAVQPDFVATASQLGQLLTEQLSIEETPDSLDSSDEGEVHRLDPTEMNVENLKELESRARPSVYTCPECSGTLFELTEGGLPHYRCRVGHAYTAESLEAHQAEELEAALWAALRALEENLGLSERLLESAQQGCRKASTKYFEEKVQTGQRRVDLLRHVLAQTIDVSRSGNGPE